MLVLTTMPKRHDPPVASWEAPANADLLKRGAASSGAPGEQRRSGRVVRVLRRLLWQVGKLLVLALIAFGAATYMVGGIGPMASLLLRKDTVRGLPAGPTVRRLALDVIGRRGATPDVLMQLARLAHMLDPDDPLWTPLVGTASRLLGHPLPVDGDHAVTLAALDAATARAVDRPLGPDGVLAWRDIDPYFVVAIDEVASTDAAIAAHRFNTLRTPDGLPTSEWYLDELVRAFGDTRPIAFVLVADSTGDGWQPMAFPPDKVPEAARRIRAATVGEALRIGLWGLEGYRPATPDADVNNWWPPIAQTRGLPTFAPAP